MEAQTILYRYINTKFSTAVHYSRYQALPLASREA